MKYFNNKTEDSWRNLQYLKVLPWTIRALQVNALLECTSVFARGQWIFIICSFAAWSINRVNTGEFPQREFVGVFTPRHCFIKGIGSLILIKSFIFFIVEKMILHMRHRDIVSQNCRVLRVGHAREIMYIDTHAVINLSIYRKQRIGQVFVMANNRFYCRVCI